MKSSFVWFLVLSFMLLPIYCVNQEISIAKEVENCLQQKYGLPPSVIDSIMLKLDMLIQDEKYHSILHCFIDETNKLKVPDNLENTIALAKDDAVLVAPKTHEIIFEDANIRILWSVIHPDEHVPFHRHQWKSVMLVTEGAFFSEENDSGKKGTDFCPCGVEILLPEDTLYAYHNSGHSIFKALLFELKV